MPNTFASATCTNCNSDFDRLPVERDDAGAYVAIPVKSCLTCGTLLCPSCDQFHCDGCGHTFCASHLVSVPDGTPRPLHCCQSCADECEPFELPAPIPPQSERRPAIARPMITAQEAMSIPAGELAALCLELIHELRQVAKVVA